MSLNGLSPVLIAVIISAEDGKGKCLGLVIMASTCDHLSSFHWKPRSLISTFVFDLIRMNLEIRRNEKLKRISLLEILYTG